MRELRRCCTFVAVILALRCAASAQDFKDPLELSKAVLSAIKQNDRSRLEALLISENEFLRFVSPKLKLRNRSVTEFAAFKKASDEALDLLLQQLGGQNWKILKTAIFTFGGTGQKPSPNNFFLSGPNVTLETQDGHQFTMRPIGAILGHDGIYKVITYSTDPKLF